MLQQDLQDYSRAWYAQMVKIWRDRIDLLGCVRTGALRSSVTGGGLSLSNADMQATFRFLQYGLYVDAGTGNGYKRGNGGNLAFLDKNYRKAHGKGKARKRRPWYSTSWYISREVLKEKYAKMLGEAFAGAFTELK